MKVHSGILIFAFLLVFYPLSALADTWAMRYGGLNSDGAISVQQASDGGFVVAGSSVFRTLDY
jgi:hypothetical protein